jgi:uncharacterized protein with PhoU and TrkA domain
MKLLKTLSFAPYHPAVQNPVLTRRANLIARLEQQKLLAQDPSHLQSVYKWLINDQGIKQRIELKKRVRQWWRVDALGTVALTVRYGAKLVEFEKGKAAIILPTKDQLVATLDTLIAAASGGELDEHLAQHSKARGVAKHKRAA